MALNFTNRAGNAEKFGEVIRDNAHQRNKNIPGAADFGRDASFVPGANG